MIAWFTFGGIDSRDMGVIVEKLPDFHRPRENVLYEKLAGRDGRLRVKDGSVDAYQTTMTVNCHGKTLSEIYAWLNGSGWMTTCNEPGYKVDVDLYAQVNDDRLRLAKNACWDSVTFTVYCQPYRYYIEDVTETATASPAAMTNPGTAKSRPRITVRGSGDVTVWVNNEYQMDFAGLTDGVVADCELQECLSLDEAQLLNDIAALDEYPVLRPGINYIEWDGNVSKITVEMRCRDL